MATRGQPQTQVRCPGSGVYRAEGGAIYSDHCPECGQPVMWVRGPRIAEHFTDASLDRIVAWTEGARDWS